MFANQYDFDDPVSYKMAIGTDMRSRNAIVDLQGNVLAYAQTGGMITPQPRPLQPGSKLFRFAGRGSNPQSAAKGGWWIERDQFEKLLSFANVHDIAVGVAARYLCLLPPEWSDLSLLIRCAVRKPILAWRGLGNSVITPRTGGGIVNMPHQNDIAARRLFQLFIPGLADVGSDVLAIEQDYPIDHKASLQGWLYL